VTPQTVVVIDNRISNLKILERLAVSLGAEVVVRTFADPDEALGFLRRHAVDLVVTDFRMPDRDGVEFVRMLRRCEASSDAPIVVITAYEDKELRYRALEAGASDYLLSPIDYTEFRARTKNLLLMRRQQMLLQRRASSLEERMRQEEQRYREAVRQSQERLLRVIDAIPAMISATDRDGRYVFVNSRYAASLGTVREAVIGKTPVEVQPSEHARRLMEVDRSLLAGETAPASHEEPTACC
jgi:PAS domain S-box-containing protein